MSTTTSTTGTISVDITADYLTPAKNIVVREDIFKGAALLGTTYRNISFTTTFVSTVPGLNGNLNSYSTAVTAVQNDSIPFTFTNTTTGAYDHVTWSFTGPITLSATTGNVITGTVPAIWPTTNGITVTMTLWSTPTVIFTAFTQTSDPEEVMAVLHEYHEEMGRLIMMHNGTIEHLAGDGIMIFFNDPVVIENPAEQAVHMAIRMQADFRRLAQDWNKRGYHLHMGIGIAQGYATLGTIGFEGRREYGAIGSVCNLASRLCSEALAGQILVSQKVFGFVEELVKAEPAGELNLKGFHGPVPAFNITGLK